MTMKTSLSAALIAASLLVPGVAAAQDAEPEKDTVELAVGGRALLGYLPLTIAAEKGFFEDHGLTVNINDFQGGSKALQALVGGSAEIVSGAYEHTILSAVRGKPLVAIALQNNSYGAVIALPTEDAGNYKGPESLRGRNIGVTAPGSASAAAVHVLIDKAGLTLDDVAIIGVGGGAGAVAAMESGQINAISNFDPVISILEQKGTIVPVVDTRTQEGLEFLYEGPFAGSAFYTTPEFAEANPNTVQAFVSGVVDALQWMQDASTEEIADSVPAEYHGGDKALYVSILEKNRGMFSRDGRITEETAANVLRTLTATVEDVANASVDIDSTYDNSFVDKALGQPD